MQIGEKCSYAHRQVDEQPSKKSQKNGDKIAVATIVWSNLPGDPHQRSSNAPKFEDQWQEQGAREAAWKLAKSVLKLKEKNRATFFSPSKNRCLPASTLKPEERPTMVITANGEVQTHEEAIVYVKELDIFLTMKVLENTPAVLSLGKLCDEN